MPIIPEGEIASDFKIPTNNSGHGNVLKVGRGISVYWDLQPTNTWLEHKHPTAQIVLALDPVEAEMAWQCGSEIRSERCSNPHLWCVPPDCPHSASWTGRSAMVVFYVERELMREECQQELTEGVVLPLAPLLQQDYLIARLCRRFHDHCHRRRLMAEPMMFASAIMLSVAVLHLCIDRIATGKHRARGLGDKRMEKLAHFLDAHFREPLTPAKLAAAMNMSVDHFGRMLRHSTGLPPMEYVWKCRLHHARLLLESGEWKVAQVAAECGFYDQSHLDRRFRKEFGCSPGFVIPATAKGNG